MSEWWTYSLSDFLLFSPRTYYRLLELYNVAIWPLQIAGVAAGLTLGVARLGKRSDRLRCALLAACWLYVGWAFHHERYAQINWAAQAFAAAFAVQSLLLIALGTLGGVLRFRSPDGLQRWLTTTLLAFALAAYPLQAPLAGRAWTTAEVFGTAPDPTALATVALLAHVEGRLRWLLQAIPLAWCAIAAATLWAIEAPERFVATGAMVMAIGIAVSSRAR